MNIRRKKIFVATLLGLGAAYIWQHPNCTTKHYGLPSEVPQSTDTLSRVVPSTVVTVPQNISSQTSEQSSFLPSDLGLTQDTQMSESPDINIVINKDKILEKFYGYYRKVLPSDFDRKSYEIMLSDTQMHRKVKDNILHPPSSMEERKFSVAQRMMEIDYLREVVNWKENPQQRSSIDLLEELIETNNFYADQDIDLKYSIATNKMELYQILFEYDSERAAILLDRVRSRDPKLYALLEHIDKTIRNRQKFEDESVIRP